MFEFNHLRDDFAALPEESQRLVVDFVSFLKQRYQTTSTNPPQANQPQRFSVEGESFVGMWSDRAEMQDSTGWVRQIREQYWRG